MKSLLRKTTQSSLALLLSAGISATGQDDTGSKSTVIVTIENMAPYSGNFLTPVWVGFHDGSFDIYDSGASASSLPIDGSNAVESLSEDGNTGPIMEDFSSLVPGGTQSTVLSNGPIPPFAPGQTVSRLFEVDSSSNKYFSYASMIIPSNDAWIANGSPAAHPIFDDSGDFVGTPFYVSGAEVLDAGTEVNDEAPANTAFFGQAAPNTGDDENGVVGFHPGFNIGPGGILGDPMFHNADFLQENQNVVRFSFTKLDKNRPLFFNANLGTTFETPSPTVEGNPNGEAFILLTNGGREILYFAILNDLSSDITGAHLHLAPVAQTGPVVARLRVLGDQYLFGRIRDNSVRGPLENTESPLDSLLAEIVGGNVYINVHTEENPSGEIRGQVQINQAFLN